ncbi:cyclin-like protein, partial [Diaporthe sp. PMI_573]
YASFSLLRETLFLTINLLDRYCSERVVYKQHYQLIGCAALLIAAKYGDKKDRVPRINELNNMCCGLYDAGMFTQMEMHVLNTLMWNIGHPTVDFFQSIIWADEQDDREVRDMTAYLCEIALYHRDFVSTKPSIMARASHGLARAILNRPQVNAGEWDRDCRDTLLILSQHLHQPSVTLSRKYSFNHFSRASTKLADFLAKQAALQRPPVNAPATPPAQCGSPVQSAEIYSTPLNGHSSAPGVADDYMTPPITPDGASFG